MINKHYSLLSSVESDKLEKVIGERFRNEMLFPRKSAIVAFFTNILKQGEGFRMVEDPSELEVLDIFYYAPAPMSFLMAEPSGYFISSGHVLTEATLELPDYHYSDIDDFVLKVVSENGVDAEAQGTEPPADYSYFWEDSFEEEASFIRTCWQEAKKATGSDIIAFYMASDSGGNPIDLENGNEIAERFPDYTIEHYLRDQGILPNKDLYIVEKPDSFLGKVLGWLGIR